ncbi:MAG: epimerase [Phycisphaeraceae bacterium]|nr:MAG: epimerase [Phycisphaeraceae bacterium]
MDSQRVVVTGAAGFIGSHVCEALMARGATVVGYDSFDPFYDRAIKERNLGEVRASANAAVADFSFVEADLCDATAFAKALADARATGVIHLAAKAGVRPSIEDPAGYVRANVLGTQVVLSESTRHGCSRVVCASSSSVYGNNDKTPFSEEDSVEHPISPYAATKRACELIGETHHALTKTPVSMLRFFTVFGPRQRPDLAIGLFLRKVGAGEPIRMFGDGTTSRDYTYIDDIVAGVLAAYDKTPEFGYRIWNLGGDHPTTLAQLIETVGAVAGRDPIVNREPMQAGDVERTWADQTRSKAELGYAPTTSIREGIERQWAWLTQNA